MIPLLWILSAYAFARVFEADTLYQIICYGTLFCLSGAALAFMDDVISDKLRISFVHHGLLSFNQEVAHEHNPYHLLPHTIRNHRFAIICTGYRLMVLYLPVL